MSFRLILFSGKLLSKQKYYYNYLPFNFFFFRIAIPHAQNVMEVENLIVLLAVQLNIILSKEKHAVRMN